MLRLLSLLLALAMLQGQATSPAPQFNTDDWNHFEPPFRIAGPIHYVGTNELGAYLVATPAGHIMLDGGMPSSAAVMERSIRALGFKPEDIRILLITQAHFDHAGSLAHYKRLSGARAEIMQGDDTLVADGGASDYLFSGKAAFGFPPVKVDRVLKDGDTVTLGGVTLTALRTAGHTPGCTTWTTTVSEGARSYFVVFPGSGSVNEGTRFVDRPSYPGILEDYRRTFERLASLKPDIFLGAHTSFFDLRGKRAKMTPASPAAAFADPEGYRQLVGGQRARFERELARQKRTAR